jgi:hypothetical protein
MGWASKKNGELLALVEADFDVFLHRGRGHPDAAPDYLWRVVQS